MITQQDAMTYLGIDYADDLVTANVQRALNAAESYLRGAVGDDVNTYLPDDPRVDDLVLCYLDELYSERGVSAKAGNAIRRLVSDMELQLRQELARAREAAAHDVR